MEIKASCKFDLNSVKALTHLNLFKKANPKKRMIIWSVIYAILFLFFVFAMNFVDTDGYVWFYLIILVLVWTLVFFQYKFLPKLQYKALAKMKDVVNEYTFLDNIVKVSSLGAEYKGCADIEYSLFVKAYETSKFIFLFQTKNQVFIVDKSTIEGGTAEDLQNKLKIHIKEKYIICKY